MLFIVLMPAPFDVVVGIRNKLAVFRVFNLPCMPITLSTRTDRSKHGVHGIRSIHGELLSAVVVTPCLSSTLVRGKKQLFAKDKEKTKIKAISA